MKTHLFLASASDCGVSQMYDPRILVRQRAAKPEGEKPIYKLQATTLRAIIKQKRTEKNRKKLRYKHLDKPVMQYNEHLSLEHQSIY